MAVTLTVSRVNSITAGALFQAAYTVTASANIGPAVFLTNTATQAFGHVATAADMQTYPDTRAQALVDGAQYYRQNTATVAFAALADTQAFITLTDSRLTALCVEQNALLPGFEGTTVLTVTS